MTEVLNAPIFADVPVESELVSLSVKTVLFSVSHLLLLLLLLLLFDSCICDRSSGDVFFSLPLLSPPELFVLDFSDSLVNSPV